MVNGARRRLRRNRLKRRNTAANGLFSCRGDGSLTDPLHPRLTTN